MGSRLIAMFLFMAIASLIKYDLAPFAKGIADLYFVKS